MRTYEDFPGLHSEPFISVDAAFGASPGRHFCLRGVLSPERPPDQLLTRSHIYFSCRLRLMFQACVTERENNAGISPNQLK